MKIGLLSLLLILLLLIVVGCTKQVQEENEQVKLDVPETTQKVKGTAVLIDMDYCESDDDCACGMSLETADCYVGNRDYIQDGATKRVQDGGLCDDFCNGETGNLELKCVQNNCVAN